MWPLAARRADGGSVVELVTLLQKGHDAAVDVGVLGALPDWYWTVPYVASRYPGAVPRGRVRHGANCQLWAYEVLGFYGFAIPDLRSDELWCDRSVGAG